ncbi:single-stranded DNA-binding protein [Crossiella sp. NPDC003009]
MFETPVTVIGRISSEIRVRHTASNARVAGFRLVSRSRRYDKDRQEWTSGDSLSVWVSCFDQIATAVTATLRRNDQILVHGAMSTREYDATDGTRRYSTELRAEAIGPNLRHCTADVLRPPEFDQYLYADQPFATSAPTPQAPEPLPAPAPAALITPSPATPAPAHIPAPRRLSPATLAAISPATARRAATTPSPLDPATPAPAPAALAPRTPKPTPARTTKPPRPTTPDPQPAPTSSAAVRRAAASARAELGGPRQGDLEDVLAELDHTRQEAIPVA